MLLACEDILEAHMHPQLHSSVHPCLALQQNFLCLALHSVSCSLDNADATKLHSGIIWSFWV